MSSLTSSCGGDSSSKDSAHQETEELKPNVEAQLKLQGIWMNADSEEPVFMVRGDSIIYPDTINLPVRFNIIGDSLVLRGDEVVRYKIQKQTDHVFHFLTSNGETVKLHKSENPDDSIYFTAVHIKPVIYNKVTKRDTVVTHAGDRYHVYVFVNPSKNKVYTDSYNEEGMSVDNFYYDNIIHLSVFKGSTRVHSRDFTKKDFSSFVPAKFLQHATLSDVRYRYVDDDGFHFDATICIPNGALCYMVQVVVKTDGSYDLQLMDY